MTSSPLTSHDLVKQLTTNYAYISEVSAHWIAAYFRSDKLRLPRSVDEAHDLADRNAAWVRRRYPFALNWLSDSNSTSVGFWSCVLLRAAARLARRSHDIILHCSWPQIADGLLEDMGLPAKRSGGNWLTWLFKTTNIEELAKLKEERDAKRRGLTT